MRQPHTCHAMKQIWFNRNMQLELTFICNIHTVLRMKSVGNKTGNKNLANIAHSNLQPQTVYIKCYRIQRFTTPHVTTAI